MPPSVSINIKKHLDFYSFASFDDVFGSGMGKNQGPESEINILDPQHCFFLFLRVIFALLDPDTQKCYFCRILFTVPVVRCLMAESELSYT